MKRVLGLIVLTGALAWPALPSGQSAARKATTVTAVVAYPVFFQGQRVRVRSEIRQSEDDRWLDAEGQRLFLVPTSESRSELGRASGLHEILGVFWDVGRLEPEDPRLGSDVRALAQRVTGKDWPGRGELLLLIVDALESAQPFSAPSVRALALDPDRYADQQVTLTGRFRARNLYGDLPDSPTKGRWDFIIQSADASIWVTGIRPRGKGFDFNVNQRLDTGRWLEVAGRARSGGGLAWLEATLVTIAKPQEEAVEDAAPVRPTQGPAPEVVFSAPTQDEGDVELQTRIRIQFSRDIDAASFKEHVRVGYAVQQVPPIAFSFRYNEGNRVLEIQFSQPLERFRAVRVDLLDGIEARDGAPLKPWTLTFETGGG